MDTMLLAVYVTVRLTLSELGARAREEAGEGVISTAIAVLITALLGAAMWAAFNGIFARTTERVGTAVDGLGTDGERGSGTVSMLFGVAAFLSLLFLAVQVLVHLYATSVVSAAAFDAARLASGAAATGADAARAHGLGLLDFSGSVQAFEVRVGADAVTVHVAADSPALLPSVVSRALNSAAIDRTVTLRRERPR